MRQGDQQWSDRVMEKWSNEIFNTPTLQHSNTSTVGARRIPRRAKATRAFALYEVLIGVAVFALGVIALGRAVENCINEIGRASCRERGWVWEGSGGG